VSDVPDAEPPVRVLIADDEPLARERLRMLLERHAGYEVVGESEDGAATVAAIAELRPDVVLLDIRMPELSGIEVAEALDAARGAGGHAPAVVFVTAYEEHARRAFDVHAVDYLLKPVDRERLARALERVEARRAARGASASPAAIDPALRAFLDTLRAERAYPPRFLVRDAKGALSFVRADEIDWVDAQGNYVRLHAGGRAHLVRDTMKAFEEKLNPASFVRVHRSAIVNLDRVQRLEPYTHGEYVVTLRDGTRLRTSRAHSARLQALLK
jgi:two-component system, LytTR family, response regulator